MAQYVSARRAFNGLTRVDMEDYFDDMEIENLYQWIDRIPLTRPKKNLAKDFSDGGNSLNTNHCLLRTCTEQAFMFAVPFTN